MQLEPGGPHNGSLDLNKMLRSGGPPYGPSGMRAIVVGASGHGQNVADVARAASYDVVGFLDPFLEGDCDGAPILPNLGSTDLATTVLFLGIGSNFRRQAVYEEILQLFPHASFPPLIHPSASVSPSVKLGQGVVIMALSSIANQSTLADGVLVGAGASLDHDSSMAQFASLGPGVHCGGNVSLGVCSAIGIGATLMHGVTIGSNSVVGAQSLVTGDVSDFEVTYGVPATTRRTRAVDEPYL